MFTENKMKPSKKWTPSQQSNMEEIQWCLGLLWCHWHWVLWLCAWHHEIKRLPRHFGAQCSSQCQKAESLSKVMGLALASRQWPFKKHPRMVQDKMLDCSEVASKEFRSKSHWAPVGRSEKSSWEKAPFKSGRTGAVCTEEWAKLPVERCRKLIHGSRKCLTADILSKGRATKY